MTCFIHLMVHAHARCLVGYYSSLPICKWNCYQELQDGDFKFQICGITDFHNGNLYKSTICSKQAEEIRFYSSYFLAAQLLAPLISVSTTVCLFQHQEIVILEINSSEL